MDTLARSVCVLYVLIEMQWVTCRPQGDSISAVRIKLDVGVLHMSAR